MIRHIGHLIIEKLNYITVGYVPFVESVKLMVEEHYDIPEYENCILFCNVLPECTDDNINWVKHYNKSIYYMLEHKTTDEIYNSIYYHWDTPIVEQMCRFGISEMWTMDYLPQFAVRCSQTFNVNIIYRPVRYTTLIKPVPNIHSTPKTVDCCSVGLIQLSSPQRCDFYNELELNHLFSFKGITQVYNTKDVIPELNSARYILDVPRLYESITQNQVRIFELLCMGYTVITKKCSVNLFPNLIYEFDNIYDVVSIINRNQYINPTEAYKEMTYTDEAYEKYVNCLIEQWNTLD